MKAYSGVITDKPRKEGTERIVQQKTLDSYNFKTVDLIKIDVEGHEFRVLKGGENTIKKYSPIIIIEDNGSDEKWGKETGAIDLLKEMGYEIKVEYAFTFFSSSPNAISLCVTLCIVSKPGLFL